MKQLLSIFILFLFIVSCDPCDDCDTVSYEPTVSLVFINQDSIAELDTLISINALKTDTLDSIIGTIDSEETFKIDSLNKVKSDLDSANGVYNSIKSTINSGLLQLDRIEILGTGTEFTYEDSATVWSIPLSYDAEFNQYEVTIEGISDIIELSYENYQELDEERNVIIRARNIQVLSFTRNQLNEIESNCEETCLDGEATFTIYF
ncbi:hypothetical protein [Ekhidna sp.]|uniref:hypothetical protein n=1 Tax=Ekhidna sp. TaxID=2608089 RepID=UPI003B5BB2E4